MINSWPFRFAALGSADLRRLYIYIYICVCVRYNIRIINWARPAACMAALESAVSMWLLLMSWAGFACRSWIGRSYILLYVRASQHGLAWWLWNRLSF